MTNTSSDIVRRVGFNTGGQVTFLRAAFLEELSKAGKASFAKRVNKICLSGFDLTAWAKDQGGLVFFTGCEEGLVRFDWGWAEFCTEGKSFFLEVFGQTESDVDTFLAKQDKYGFRDEGVTILWMYGPDWQHSSSTRVPVEPVTPIISAYPWLGQSVEEYADDYLNSSASILILIGPPGTGKTSFIRQIISHGDLNATLTYETNLLREDGIFANFIGSEDTDALILEDADNYMGNRKGGNDMMHRFLNVSNGLISPLKGKKIIFSTNLPSVSDIDDALMRPGRCFDVLQFRTLNKEEATAVAREVHGKDHEPLTKSSYTLAEITNPAGENRFKKKHSLGFLG